MSSVVIREAARSDMTNVMELIVELATFEGYPDGPKITSKDLERDAFDSSPPKFICLVAEDLDKGKLVGQVMGNYAYSSWTGLAMYIEDIYVRPEYRKQKIGHRLMKEYCKLAQSKGCSRIDWHVLMSNTTAIDFYRKHGAYCIEETEKRFCMRLMIDKINTIASGDTIVNCK